MALKKQNFGDNEIAIFDDAVIYKRGEYWQFRMWLSKEHKYARESLKTRSESTARDLAKAKYLDILAELRGGKTYFSLTTKQGTEKYLKQRWTDYEASLIVKGRYATIKTHLEHWLDYIKRDTKLKELKRTDCENYYHERTKTKKQISISQTTVENEQSTINAMMSWLFRHNETYIDAFDFKKLPRIDRGNDETRRDTFTDDEIAEIKNQLEKYIAEALDNIEEDGNLVKYVAGSYLLISIITGLRRGEQLQLRWSDISYIEHNVGGEDGVDFSLVKITVRAETSKVRRTRRFAVQDLEYFSNLEKMLRKRHFERNKESVVKDKFATTLVFSANGKTAITTRAIGYHFDKILELAEIANLSKRDIVPYSFRHYFITQRVNSGLTPTQVAEICGTSVTQIDKTYYHTTHDKMISNAMADYIIKDGMIIIRKI